MSGQHATKAAGGHHAPPPPELERDDVPEMPVPQRERVTYLTHLAREFDSVARMTTAITSIGHYPVLNVIPLDLSGERRAATIGCVYHAGAWWFVWYRSGRVITPANDLSRAAEKILAGLGRSAP